MDSKYPNPEPGTCEPGTPEPSNPRSSNPHGEAAYCREVEAYLCRKNDGHLIRIVGPAFEQVSGWAREGIPLKVALSGVDRYFERYYRKGPRRRPVRIEFCEHDVRDAFDDWRRAVGVAQTTSEPRRSSLAAHLDRAMSRLTTVRGSTHAAAVLGDSIDRIVRRLDALQPEAKRARGEQRATLTAELDALDRDLAAAAVRTLDDSERARLTADASRELEPFRTRMLPDSYARALEAAFERLVRERFGLPVLRYE
jgi:hypothetical protein